jgi:hypothetical protein
MAFSETPTLIQFPTGRRYREPKKGNSYTIKLKFLSYSYVLHNLILTRTLIAANCWASEHPDFALVGQLICYELPGKVIPDGWLLFEEQTNKR